MPDQTTPELPAPPAGLSDHAAQMWRATVERYALDDAHLLMVLEAACRQLTTAEQCRAVLDAEGLTVAGARGQRIAHPLLGQVRQAELAAARLVRELGLDDNAGAGR